MSSFSSSSFSTSGFSTLSFDFGGEPPPPPVDTSTEIYAGWPADWKRRNSKHWTSDSDQLTRFDLEIAALDEEENLRLSALGAAKEKIESERTLEVEKNENIAVYESIARQEIEKREQFLIYEQKMLKEINDLRIRRVRLIRQRQEEGAIIAILYGLPPLN